MGCGACAAVLVPVHGEEYKYHDSKAVGQKVTSVMCELEGNVLGLMLSIKPIISVGHTDTKCYYQCGNSVTICLFLSVFAHKRPSPFFCTYPTKTLLNC